MKAFATLVEEVKNCRLCEKDLPLGARPVFQIDPQASILIAGQAPGIRVHRSGLPFDDPSGDRLRDWLGLSPEVFYDASKIALLPMGFCYPGTGSSGDLPPRPECAEAWRSQLLDQLPRLQLTVVLGKYAQDYHFGKRRGTLTALVKSWEEHWPHSVPLPHPSPRNNIWLKKNPWFEQQLLPPLRQQVKQLLAN